MLHVTVPFEMKSIQVSLNIMLLNINWSISKRKKFDVISWHKK